MVVSIILLIDHKQLASEIKINIKRQNHNSVLAWSDDQAQLQETKKSALLVSFKIRRKY